MAKGEQAALTPSFPCVTWPVQANMLTGKLPAEHGVVANGFYWRDRRQVEMWTAGNDKDRGSADLGLAAPARSAADFRRLVSDAQQGVRRGLRCMPAPVHNPDGSEGALVLHQADGIVRRIAGRVRPFPAAAFLGTAGQYPVHRVDRTIRRCYAARRQRPRFFYIYLPHLEYAAQRSGPDSEPAQAALGELDEVIGELRDGFHEALHGRPLAWLAASEYVITRGGPCGLSQPHSAGGRAAASATGRGRRACWILEASRAWALVDHQFSHVFVRDGDEKAIARVQAAFRRREGIAEVLAGDERAKRAGPP